MEEEYVEFKGIRCFVRSCRGAHLCRVAHEGYGKDYRSISDERVKIEGRQVDNPTCIFLKSDEEIDRSSELVYAHKARIERETYGYSGDISLNEAIKILNDELKCFSFWASLPPLTEQEVIAAAIEGPDYGVESVWQKQKHALTRIAERRIMPKGSLLTAEGGGCTPNFSPRKDQTCAKGLKIYLFFDLDKNPRAGLLNPVQVFLIRKNLFTTEVR